MEYTVEIKQVFRTYDRIEAESEDEAISKAEANYIGGCYFVEQGQADESEIAIADESEDGMELITADEARGLAAKTVDEKRLGWLKKHYTKKIMEAAKRGEHSVCVCECDPDYGTNDEVKKQLRSWLEEGGYKLVRESRFVGGVRQYPTTYATW